MRAPCVVCLPVHCAPLCTANADTRATRRLLASSGGVQALPAMDHTCSDPFVCLMCLSAVGSMHTGKTAWPPSRGDTVTVHTNWLHPCSNRLPLYDHCYMFHCGAPAAHRFGVHEQSLRTRDTYARNHRNCAHGQALVRAVQHHRDA